MVKEVHGSGGYGMLIGPMADKATIAAFRAKLKVNPKGFIAQPTLALSTCPTCVEAGVAPRHVDLRPFVLTGRDRVRIVPGGLTRVALKQGSLVVNSSQGGGTKDTWVLDGDECSRAPPITSIGSRATSSARSISRASWRRRSGSPRCRSPMSARPTNGTRRWRPPAVPARSSPSMPRPTRQTVTDFLAFSTDNPSSIRNCFEVARTNARAVRTALTIEMWDAINGTWLELKRFGNGPASREEFSRFLRWVQESSLRFDGSAYRTMLRNDAYWFSRLGVYIERADNTARILDVKYHLLLPAHEHVGGPLDYFQWAAILRSVSALTAYHWVYRESLKPWLIADLLDPQRPDAAFAVELLREPGAEPRPHRPRLRPAGPGAAPGPRHPHAAAEQPHGRHLPARPARVHRRLRRRQQPPRQRDFAAVSGVTER